MKKFAALTISIFLILLASVLFAQGEKTEIGELMRSNGRIYVVVAVMLTILAGLIFYLVRLDRKISRMERES